MDTEYVALIFNIYHILHYFIALHEILYRLIIKLNRFNLMNIFRLRTNGSH